MAQNNDSPGKRLKREQAKNTLYVSRPDDPRLQRYQDSLALHNMFAGSNPIEINKTFQESFSKDVKGTPKRNYAPLKTGPYGSALSKVIKTSTPPLDANKRLGQGFDGSSGAYGKIINNLDPNLGAISKSKVPMMIIEDAVRQKMNLKRDFAPIGYQSVEHYDPWFVTDYWTRPNTGQSIIEQTKQRENKITPKEVRAIFPKISDKELNEIIQRATGPQTGTYAVIDKTGQINRVIDRTQYPNAVRSEGIVFEPTKSYVTSPIYAKPKRPVVFRPNEPVEPIQPRQAPSPIFSREEIIAPVPRPVDVPPAPPMRQPVMEEEVVTERPVARKPPKAVMPRRAGGWSNQPLLMQLFPKLYER